MTRPDTPAADPLIRLDGVAKSFALPGGTRLDAVLPTSLDIARGDIFGLVGRSGAGKSTLLRLVNLSRTRPWPRTSPSRCACTAAARARRSAPASTPASHSSAWARRRRATRRNSPAGRSSAPRSPGRWRASRRCCSATSRPRRSTPRPTAGLLATLGVTIVVVTHELAVVNRLCRQVAVVESGRIAERFAVADRSFAPRTGLGRELRRLEAEGRDARVPVPEALHAA